MPSVTWHKPIPGVDDVVTPASRTGCWQPTDDRRILAVCAPAYVNSRPSAPNGTGGAVTRQAGQIAWAAAGVNNVTNELTFTSQSTALNGAGRPLRHVSGRPTRGQFSAPLTDVVAHAADLRMKR
jgi:hypothetical protein